MKATMNTDLKSIKTAALALLADPDRKFGRGVSHTLENIVAQALVIASVGTPLKPDEFEKARQEIVQSIRTPANVWC